MKVIGFTGNYSKEDSLPQAYLMTDSCVLYTGRPFFVPDFAQSFVATPAIVVRMNRLGKCVSPKFAHRYWDAFTAAFTVKACHSDDARLMGLDRAFDGAAVVGDWITVDSCEDVAHVPVMMSVNGQVVANRCLADMQHPLEELIAATSTRCSIKMGDLLFTGEAGEALAMTPGDHLTASINGNQVLDVKVRL